MSAAREPKPLHVTVDGFTYQVFIESVHVPHKVTKIHVYHWRNGAAVAEDCPVSETGVNKHYFGPCRLDRFPTKEDAAIHLIKELSDLTRYENRTKKAAQFSLF